MNAKVLVLSILVFLSMSGRAFGQLCSISSYPYGCCNSPKMHGNEFKAMSVDLPFIDKQELKTRYSQFWINTDVLNVRIGPSLEYKIKSRTFYGNLVFAYAKIGDWVAIAPGLSNDDFKIEPKWVHIRYLSAKRIEEQVDTEVLKKQCSFRQYGESNTNISDSCSAVVKYLQHQKMLSRSHDYYDKYFRWRNSQDNPESYRNLPCDRPR